MKKTITFLSKRAAMMLLATMLLILTAQTAWAQNPASIGSISYNNSISAYEIKTVNNLKDLAVYVNGTGTYSTSGSESTHHNCAGMTFKMTGNISFSASDNWYDSNTTSNFTSIGGYDYTGDFDYSTFNGTFDGQGFTIYNLRIYADTYNQGLFGRCASSTTIRNVKLSSSRITGQGYTGGIVGYIFGGTVSNCEVSSTVAVCKSSSEWNYSFGGIVGVMTSNCTVENCTSSVTLRTIDQSMSYGAIVGKIEGGTIRGCLAQSAVVPTTSNGHIGAIVGYKTGGTLTGNGYRNCTVGGVSNATGVGCDGSDIDGNAAPIYSISFNNGVSTSTDAPFTISTTKYYIKGQSVTLTGGTPPSGQAVAGYTTTAGTITVNQFTIPGSAATIGARFVNEWAGTGADAANAYIIGSTDDLDLLSFRASCGENYSGKFFELSGNIDYTASDDWDNVSGMEDNFLPISSFSGTLDGKGYAIRGIRVYRGGTDSSDEYLGLFRQLNGTVKGVTLANTRITGFRYMGGFAGRNTGTITDCHVAANVALFANMSSTYESLSHGGIAGDNDNTGTVSYCTSSVQMRTTGGDLYSSFNGGIVGNNNGAVNHCLAIGAKVLQSGKGTTGYPYSGAIVGKGNASISNNYYVNCTPASYRGSNSVDIAGKAEPAYELSAAPALLGSGTGDGAVKAYGNYGLGYNSKYYLVLIPLSETEGVTYLTTNLATEIAVPVEFKREFTADKSSTICLPFSLTSAKATAVGSFYEFVGVDKSNPADWVVTMQDTGNKMSGDLAANTPYLFKPKATGELTFDGTVDVTTMAAGTTPSMGHTDGWVFRGTFERIDWTTDPQYIYGFAIAGAGGPGEGVFFRVKGGTNSYALPFRAYLDGTVGTHALASRRGAELLPDVMTVHLIGADGNTTGIGTMDTKTGEVTFDGWYTFDGHRLAGKPSSKGVYINNGKKVVIK